MLDDVKLHRKVKIRSYYASWSVKYTKVAVCVHGSERNAVKQESVMPSLSLKL